MTTNQIVVVTYVCVSALVFLGFVFFDKYGEVQTEHEFATLQALVTKPGLFLFMALLWPIWIFSMKAGMSKNNEHDQKETK